MDFETIMLKCVLKYVEIYSMIYNYNYIYIYIYIYINIYTHINIHIYIHVYIYIYIYIYIRCTVKLYRLSYQITSVKIILNKKWMNHIYIYKIYVISSFHRYNKKRKYQ